MIESLNNKINLKQKTHKKEPPLSKSNTFTINRGNKNSLN